MTTSIFTRTKAAVNCDVYKDYLSDVGKLRTNM